MDDDDQDIVPAKVPDIRVEQVAGLSVIRFRPVARWGGHELSLLNTTLAKLRRQRRRCVAIDMGGVRHLRSGYFGLLFDTRQHGVRIELLNPEPCVQGMLWFQEFAEEVATGRYALRREPLHRGQIYVSNCNPGRPPVRPCPTAVPAPLGVAGESAARPATV